MAKYIDLEVAVRAFNNFDAGRADSPPCTLLTPEEFAEYLYELPTADVVPVVHGRWVGHTRIHGFVYCSACKDVYLDEEWLRDGKWGYCPNCGARMDGEAE